MILVDSYIYPWQEEITCWISRCGRPPCPWCCAGEPGRPGSQTCTWWPEAARCRGGRCWRSSQTNRPRTAVVYPEHQKQHSISWTNQLTQEIHTHKIMQIFHILFSYFTYRLLIWFTINPLLRWRILNLFLTIQNKSLQEQTEVHYTKTIPSLQYMY